MNQEAVCRAAPGLLTTDQLRILPKKGGGCHVRSFLGKYQKTSNLYVSLLYMVKSFRKILAGSDKPDLYVFTFDCPKYGVHGSHNWDNALSL